MTVDRLSQFKSQIDNELKNNILKFWIDNAQDNVNGGFYGYISHDLQIEKNHSKSSVLNARILWTFSTAYLLYKEDKYLTIARRAYGYIKKHFIDYKYYGVYWELDSIGKPINTKNQVYSIAFTIYGLSQFYRAAGEADALELSFKLYSSLEQHARDKVYGGYLEALKQDWTPLDDMSLSSKDMNVPKSMNTNLHVMEAYTNLLKICDYAELRESVNSLLEIMLNKILDHKTWSFDLFFSMDWSSLADIFSYGHDIEGSWLIYEAAHILGDSCVLAKVKDVSIRMADEVMKNGVDKVHGGIFNDMHNGMLDDGKDWWPQAEAVVGFYNAYQITGDEAYLDQAISTWEFIQSYISDHTNGEWFWGVTRDGNRVTNAEKAGSWKCPYHNSRMCFEITKRIE